MSLINRSLLKIFLLTFEIKINEKNLVNYCYQILTIFPYKFHQWHKLETQYYEKRMDFAHWFLSLPMNTKYFFICSDEAYFYLTLSINKKNYIEIDVNLPHMKIRNTFAWRESFSLVRDFCQKNFWPILIWRVRKSTQLLRNDKNFSLAEASMYN